MWQATDCINNVIIRSDYSIFVHDKACPDNGRKLERFARLGRKAGDKRNNAVA